MLLEQSPDRFFDPDPSVRRIARELYEEVKSLPILSPHGHVEPALLAKNEAFPTPAALLVTPDHYVIRMLYSAGVRLESLGVQPLDGTPAEDDPREIWRLFARHFHLFAGTPTGAWLNHTLHEQFDVSVKLDALSADRVYAEIDEKLKSPEFLPRALFRRFNIELLATTDAAADTLEHHLALNESELSRRVIPTFRPDSLMQIADPDWPTRIELLSQASMISITGYDSFLRALRERRKFFIDVGAVATDHAVLEPNTHVLPLEEIARIFDMAMNGRAQLTDQAAFGAHMLMEMARMSTEDGLVMQLHPGAFRNHNLDLFMRFGPNVGADIPVQTEFTRNLYELLNTFGNDPQFRLILFTLDESTYSRELAPLAGHYPAVRIGPAWWFFDSIEGLRRHREATLETAGVYNTAGFNDDTRAFCSIPARHDLSRRVDCNFLAGRVARHIIDLADARTLARALAYDLVKDTYRLPTPAPST